MPISPVITRAACTPTDATDATDVTQLADTLWHLSLKIPAGSVRKHACAIRIIATQMDEVLAAAFGAGSGQASVMRALMQELTGQALSEADMRDTTQIEKAYPDIRLAIGKISLLYHQASNQTAGVVTGSDVFNEASPSRRNVPPVPSCPSPHKSFTSEVAEHGSDVRLHSESTAAALAMRVNPRLSPSPTPLAPPTPRRSPPQPPSKPAVTPVMPLRRAAEPSELQRASAMTIAASSRAPVIVPASLKRCLALLESDALDDVADAAACFLSPQTNQVWSDPVIDLRDGKSYERSQLPAGVPRHHVRTNDAAKNFIRTWRDNLERDPTAFASILEASVQRDEACKPIYDPVIACGTGVMYSAQTLVDDFARDASSAALTPIAADETFCVNRLLVRMMRHFNIGVPDAALSHPAQFWPQAASHLAQGQAASLLRDAQAVGHPHLYKYGQHMQGLWNLLAATNCEPEMMRCKPQLEAILAGHANVLFSSNSEDYHEAFNAGVNVNPLIDSIAILLKSVRGASLVAGLRIMRADCFDVLGNAPQTIGDLQKAALAWPESLALWGREQSLRQLVMTHGELP